MPVVLRRGGVINLEVDHASGAQSALFFFVMVGGDQTRCKNKREQKYDGKKNDGYHARTRSY